MSFQLSAISRACATAVADSNAPLGRVKEALTVDD
jgi:hypothetical protein